jgi:shikimate kinase
MESRPPQAVFLVGFMGAGKTSVGKALAQRLHWFFLDLDSEIEQRCQRRIDEIFRESGDAGFREAERAALRHLVTSLPRRRPVVVALGGGAYVPQDNCELLRGHPVVFLDTSFEEAQRRCAEQGGQRPLFRDQNLFRQLYEARRRAYMKADLRVDASAGNAGAIAEEVASRLGLHALDESAPDQP